MVKTFKKLLLKHKLSYGPVTSNVVLGLEYYQDCLNDDFGLILTFLQQVQLWENANLQYSVEILASKIRLKI